MVLSAPARRGVDNPGAQLATDRVDSLALDAEKVHALVPSIRAAADEIEAKRCLPPALARALADAGLFRMFMPRSLGGAEVDPVTRMEVLELLAAADASVAWCVEIGSGTAYMLSGWLHPEAARVILCAEEYTIVGGAVAVPGGRASLVDGGYRVTGHWSWGSGCTHSSWLASGCLLIDGDEPRLHRDRTPVLRSMVFPISDVEIIDTWTSTGFTWQRQPRLCRARRVRPRRAQLLAAERGTVPARSAICLPRHLHLSGGRHRRRDWPRCDRRARGPGRGQGTNPVYTAAPRSSYGPGPGRARRGIG